MKLESLNELFIDELEDVYSAENMIIKALPKMIEKAVSPPLKVALNAHLEETRGQVVRLDKIFDELENINDEIDRTDKKCKGINLLGRPQWARLLQETLDEEKKADEKLNNLSTNINLEARAA
jgi:ferritin-like metal-binding protein YciE